MYATQSLICFCAFKIENPLFNVDFSILLASPSHIASFLLFQKLVLASLARVLASEVNFILMEE